MMSEKLNIFEYEEILLGIRDRFESSMKGDGPTDSKRIEAGNIWRYAVEYLLGWTPRQAKERMNDELVRKLKLDKTLSVMGIQMTNNYVPDYSFALRYAFPDEIRSNPREDALEEYKHVSKLGKWSNDKIPHKYPKKFFIGEDGIRRAEYVLDFAVDTWLRGKYSNAELYDFFANKRKAKKWLVKKNLGTPVPSIYETPLEYFHNAVHDRYKDDFLYNEKIFEGLYEEALAAKDESE